MSDITITIDGKACRAKEGEYILNIARANNIFIPAICYLTNCSPTLACRICLVEADGKQVYACNAKAKDGMEVVTLTDNIAKERRAIMEVYDVNHPLECGVCDQSGECELQNYTLEMGVDSQSYAIRDTHKTPKDWGLIHYDPALCIVCERCVTVCKDMIGDAALKTVPRDGDALEKDYKTSMPKDAYSMWNKLNKSLIGPVKGDSLECTDCGECIAVCPVGALVSADFQYTSNAWELEKIPATCGHCSAGCQIFYDVKHTSIDNPEPKIYRVKNEWNYVSLCGAGRFGYDYENRVAAKDDAAFALAVAFFKKADTIAFDSMISNEEALVLQKLKERFGYRLVNEDARRFQSFINAYAAQSGKSLYDGDLKSIHNSNFVITVGTALKSDNPRVRYAVNNAITMNKGAGICFHPVGDPIIEGFGKNFMTINHAPGVEEAALYLILDLFADRAKLPKKVGEYLDAFHEKGVKTVTESVKEKVVKTVTKTVKDEATGEEKEVTEEVTKMVPKKVKKEVEYDKNGLLDLLGAPEDFDEKLKKMLAKKDTYSLVVGEDIVCHPQCVNLAKLAAMVEAYTDFVLTVVPSKTNTLGVALICELDEKAGKQVVGYNCEGDFKLSALGDGDLDMPAFNQQEGTITTIDKRVVPTNAALPYNGYELSDIANELGIKSGHLIDYTAALPRQKGFKPFAFDDLPNRYTNEGEELRGYRLEVVSSDASSGDPEAIAQSETVEGELFYRCNPVVQFNAFTAKSHQLESSVKLLVSPAKAEALGVAEADNLSITIGNETFTMPVAIDKFINGDIVCVPDFGGDANLDKLFSTSRFQTGSLKKV